MSTLVTIELNKSQADLAEFRTPKVRNNAELYTTRIVEECGVFMKAGLGGYHSQKVSNWGIACISFSIDSRHEYNLSFRRLQHAFSIPSILSKV